MDTITWTGEEVVEYGKYTGAKWKTLRYNSILWYKDNLKDSPLKQCAIAEITRRKKAHDEKRITLDQFFDGE